MPGLLAVQGFMRFGEQEFFFNKGGMLIRSQF
jgi:hypothetical protein